MNFFSDILKNQVEKNRTAHAYILESKDEKAFSDAKNLAKFLLLKDLDDKNAIHRIESRNCADFKVFEKETTSISIENIREVIDFFKLPPLEMKKKVAIIKGGEYMTKEAANAILKTLEEPPSYACIIITVQNKNLLLDTVLSRANVIEYDSKDEQNVDKKTLFFILSQIVDAKIMRICDFRDFLEDYKDYKEEIIKLVKEYFLDIDIYNLTKDKELLKHRMYFSYIKKENVSSLNIQNILEKCDEVERGFSINANLNLSMLHLLLYILEEINDKSYRSKISTSG